MRRLTRPLFFVTASVLLGAVLLLSMHKQAAAQAEIPAAPAGVDDLVVNELMADNRTTLVDPDEPDETPDWIEIYNPTGSPISLAGLGLSDDPAIPDKHVITTGVTIPAQGFLVFFADSDPSQGPLHLNFKLDNAGESVVISDLSDPNNPIEIDRVDYPALGEDEAFGRLPDGSAALQNLLRPTPGERNTSDPPWITQVTLPPAPPAPVGDKVTINAVITDSVAVVTATLHYSAAGGGWMTTPMSLVGADLYAGDIPGQPLDTLVAYYVEGTDNDDESTRFPLPGREYRYLTGYLPPVLLLNEIVTQNNTIPDPDEPAETPDWIEIYNPGNSRVDLSGLSITNDWKEPEKYVIPAGVSIPAKGRVVFLADDDSGQGPLHLNFNLNKENDYVGLYGGEGTVLIDAYDIDDPFPLGVIGRIPDGAPGAAGDPDDPWTTFVCPTYNRPNILCDILNFLPVVRERD